MGKIIVSKYLYSIDCANMDGSIDEAIAELQQTKMEAEKRGFTDIQLVLRGVECDVYGDRLETDKEMAERLIYEKEAKDREVKAIADKEAAEINELARLIAKYGIPTNTTE
jgi:hypothetical protein